MRKISWLLLFVLACATSDRARLHVVSDPAAYERLAAADPDKRLVNLATLDIPLDIRYATANNFMKKQLYPIPVAYLRAPAARALHDVQAELAHEGLGIKVFDAYRPYRVTEAMWAPIRNEDYVANPAKGSRHNRGAAVDVTLIDLTTGAELPMPTPYDDFTPRASHAFTGLPAEALANRAKLLAVMTKHGFEPLPSEWWHYDFGGWQRFELLDVGLDELR
ncbi:MAG TPA: M15 family metallopeptidase [Thermoanaerobaculia bacterium]|jgi:D-alanyl-D-alanine dipeptidase